MPRETPENLLISALINTVDPMAGRTYGLLPEHFNGHREEYEWVLSFYSNFGNCPTQSALLSQFSDFVFNETETQIQWSAHEIKRAYNGRVMMKNLLAATQHMNKGQIEEAYACFEDQALELTSTPPQNVLIDHSYLDDYDKPEGTRIPMPWESLQNVTDGIGPGELWYLAARQGQGKSSLLTYIAAKAVREGHSVQMYSLEMTKRQIQSRMHATLGHQLGHKVSAREMLRRRFNSFDYKTIVNDIEAQVPGRMTIHDSSMGRVSPGVVAARASEADLILIDYVGLMYADDGTPAIKDYRVIAEISNQLNEIVQSKGARIISASQINREGDTNGPRPPALKNLAQSDHLGNDASVVLTMKRFGSGATVNSVEKNRFGPSKNLFYTTYDADHGDFSEVAVDVAHDIKDSYDE